MASLADRVSPLGVAFFTWLSITGWTAISLVCTPLFLLSLIPVPEVAQVTKPLYRKATNFVQWAWMGNVAFLLEYLFNMRVSVLCDQKTKDNEDKLMSGERSIWTSTHRTRVDWMLLWNLALRTRSLAQLKIVLKAPLRVLPIFGWAMQHFLFIFLNRRWSEDEAMLKSYLPFLNSREPESSFLIFPEGTDLSDSNLDKSNEFAKKSGLPPRFYSLYPRTKGWTYMFPKIRGSLDAVYDITIFYIDHAPHERVSEGAFISGRMPQRVIFYVERTEVKDMPTSETDLATWVETSFERKEKHLKAFNENNGKLPHGAQAVKFPDPMASFSLIIVFWLWFVTIATRLAWACGWWSIYFAIVVAAGHAIVEVALGGVDSILRKTL